MVEQELEVKFYINNLGKLEQMLRSIGAALFQPRIFELNFRFDNPAGDLAHTGKVLRLRQDAHASLTFKGPNQPHQAVSVRQEIEFTVSDFSAARHFLEALGYQVAIIYEKYRTTYLLDKVEIVLDEMPFGNFIEIEGPDPQTIEAFSQNLSLLWDARCTNSYIGLFTQLKTNRNLSFRDLTFSNFNPLQISPDDLGIRAAD